MAEREWRMVEGPGSRYLTDGDSRVVFADGWTHVYVALEVPIGHDGEVYTAPADIPLDLLRQLIADHDAQKESDG